MRNVFTKDESVTDEYQAVVFREIVDQYPKVTSHRRPSPSPSPSPSTSPYVIRKKWRLVRDQFASLFTYGCAPHSFNLHCKDILELDAFKDTSKSVRAIGTFFSIYKQASHSVLP
ncbi:hypothetical protein T492DRAFT_873414 [Pavlovales sp. CCMP2436]|nr:hypothetical protein T492DRAFT_873414 [Pavlovales sp. CCMP2436]